MRLASLVVSLGLASSLPAQSHRPFTVEDALALGDVSEPRVSPDGEWVVYTVTRLDLVEDSSRSNIYKVSFDGGDVIPLTSSQKSNTNSHFSPDGRYLAFLSDREGDESQIFVLDLHGGEPRRVSSLPSGVSDFEWSPDGARMVLVSRDPDPNKPAEGEEEKKTEPPLVINRLQFKRDGQGYLEERRNHLYVLEIAKGETRQLTHGPYDDSEPVWSPDGTEIAFVSNRTENPDANDNTDLFLVPASGGDPRQLTTNPGADRSPAFSPDGRFIAHVSVTEPELIWYAIDQLAVVPADGGRARVLTATLDRNVRRPRFSADGAHIVFLLEDSGNQHLARIDLEGNRIERLVDGPVELSDFHVSPSGELAFLQSEPHLPPEVFAWSNGGSRRLSHVNDVLLSDVRLGEVENVHFESRDGTPVEGFITKPPDFERGKPYPTLLWIHGGPVSQYATGFEAMWQVFAGAGYVVVAANPRGSSGYGKDFSRAIWADWGNKDFEDVMAAVDHAIELGYADPQRLGVGGWSYGGILTNYVITKTDRFQAATSGASETNYLACYGNDHYQHEWEKELGLPWENVERYIDLSPFTHVANIVTPTLILCGEHDWNVPLSQSEQLYQALKRRGVETTLVIYPGQSHSIRKPSYQKDRYERYLAWFGRFLGEGPTDARPTHP
ncbi:MAG TPA: S9 family peptidase [Vicinamibacteria bacterium]|nr:S9 family peptidase [Vicinamibacteria bacterium]